jgi:hypothetical protein
MYIQRLSLRFTTAPTQSVICDRKMLDFGKFCETVVNRKDSRTTKFTIYDLLWNRGHNPNRILIFSDVHHYRS